MIDATIVIPTFRRTALLRRALESCFAQQRIARERCEILVVDNSPEGSAAGPVGELVAAAPIALRYVHEPRSGICHARNCGMANARANAVAFLDDDEEASPEWLYHLLQTRERFGAEVVFAPVIAVLPDGLGQSDREFYGAYFSCTDDHPTGAEVGSTIITPRWARGTRAYPRLASGNVLLDMTGPVVRTARFDAYYSLNGGEDTHFFTQLAADGAAMVWCAEAIVTEKTPPARIGLGYIARRSFRGGQGSGHVPMRLRVRRPAMMVMAMATGALQIAAFAPRCAARYLMGRPRWRFDLHRLLLACGKVFWMVDIAPRYGREAREIAPPLTDPARPDGGDTNYANPAARRAGQPRISVLVPFHGDDPRPLALTLAAQSGLAGHDMEIVLFDDGTPDPSLSHAVRRAVDGLAEPVRLIRVSTNIGRAAARNALATSARAPWLLYLDADMSVGPDFIARHIETAYSKVFDAAFGGYSAEPVADPALALHVCLATSSDVRDAAARNRIGSTAFCTSNLLVRAEVMREVPFDEEYAGWGWEDVDWAVSAASDFRLGHVDNPARHVGWQNSDELLAKYRAASGNFSRLLGKHPELRSLPSARAAMSLKRIPGQRLLRGAWARAARARVLPLRLRTLALKLWRASWAAEAIGRP